MKAALFDLDGVVFDTEPQYTVFWGAVMREYYPQEPGLEQKIKGQTLVQIYDRYFTDPADQSVITSRLNDFERHMKFEYVPGFETFVSDLKAHGVKTAVVTSSNREKMAAVYSNHPECRQYFDRILTSEDFARSKPDPDCYLKAAAVFGVSPKECVGFEDSFNGLKAVRAAGQTVVGLATTNKAEAIMPYSDIVIPDYRELDYDKLLQMCAAL